MPEWKTVQTLRELKHEVESLRCQVESLKKKGGRPNMKKKTLRVSKDGSLKISVAKDRLMMEEVDTDCQSDKD
jgi:translation elongation factor EF-Ts